MVLMTSGIHFLTALPDSRVRHGRHTVFHNTSDNFARFSSIFNVVVAVLVSLGQHCVWAGIPNKVSVAVAGEGSSQEWLSVVNLKLDCIAKGTREL